MLRYVMLTTVFIASTVLAKDHHSEMEILDQDALLARVDWDFESAEIRTEKISEGLYVLFGIGGNIAVSIGEDGVLMVDDQFPQLTPKIEKTIGELGGGSVDFVVNTHWHFDHAEGNLAFGPKGTWLVAQENSRTMMQNDNVINLVGSAYLQEAYPEDAWPHLTFKEQMDMHLNGQSISLMHFGPAHTTGDTAVFFQGDNAIHLGDVYNNSGYPFIDVDNGGSIDGAIAFCRAALERINRETVVIPGHGPIADHASLVGYVAMLTSVRDRVAALIAEGASLEQVYEANPTEEFDKTFGDSTAFLNRVYASLSSGKESAE